MTRPTYEDNETALDEIRHQEVIDLAKRMIVELERRINLRIPPPIPDQHFTADSELECFVASELMDVARRRGLDNAGTVVGTLMTIVPAELPAPSPSS